MRIAIPLPWIVLLFCLGRLAFGQAEQQELTTVVADAFVAVHAGWSADEVVLDDELNQAFLAECRQKLPQTDTFQLNWTLLNLRKAGKLPVKATRRRNDNHDEYLYAAEIAARCLTDKYQLSMDRILCDPATRREFDQLAQQVAPEVSTYLLRKSALGLRKARRLRPELVTRVADWGREIVLLSAAEAQQTLDLVPASPGVYIFRDQMGYLYIGEASNLRSRLTQHLDHSDRKSLARYLWSEGLDRITLELHVFDPNSNARSKPMRRAYESELIRSRHPRFNIAP